MTKPLNFQERELDGEDGYDCPECGGVLVDLYGGDGSIDLPPIGTACVRCDYEFLFQEEASLIAPTTN